MNIGFDKKNPLKMLYCKKFQMPHIIQIFRKHQPCNGKMSSKTVMSVFYSSTDCAGCQSQRLICCQWGGEVRGR